MIKKLVYIFVGLLLAVALFAVIGNALAGPKECPPGQDGNCNTYRHKETGNIGCFPDNADPEGWIFVKSGCGEKKKDPTSTPAPIIIMPSPTFEQIFPTPTIKPGSIITVVPTNWHNSYLKTPTPTLVVLVESEDCSNSCLCMIATQLVIANDLQRTQIANDAKACVKP